MFLATVLGLCFANINFSDVPLFEGRKSGWCEAVQHQLPYEVILDNGALNFSETGRMISTHVIPEVEANIVVNLGYGQIAELTKRASAQGKAYGDVQGPFKEETRALKNSGQLAADQVRTLCSSYDLVIWIDNTSTWGALSEPAKDAELKILIQSMENARMAAHACCTALVHHLNALESDQGRVIIPLANGVPTVSVGDEMVACPIQHFCLVLPASIAGAYATVLKDSGYGIQCPEPLGTNVALIKEINHQ